MAVQLAKLLVAAVAAGAILFQSSAAGLSQVASSCGEPLEAGDGWLTGSLEEAGFDAGILCSLNQKLDASPEKNIQAVVVVRHGKLVYETYRAGDDEKWGRKLGVVPHTPEMAHDLRSISKSVVSLLFGIALDRHLIASIDDPVFSYFPELAALRTAEKDAIHLRHLLSMTAGLEWDERRSYSDPENSEREMIRSVNPYRFVLERPVVGKQGKDWNYSGGATQLLAGVVQRATGKWLADFAKEALFEPLGIAQFEWVKMPASGEAAAASGLRLRPRDMAKIGQLVLNKGMWNGQRVVSESWIVESTRPRMDVEYPLRYGYQWWADEKTIGGRVVAWTAAQGLGGQRIYIVPAYDLVVIVTAGLYDSKSQDWVSFDILDQYVFAAIRK